MAGPPPLRRPRPGGRLQRHDAGRARRDERRRGHHYISLFVDLDRPRLLFATPGRDAATLSRFRADLVAHARQPETISELVMDMSPAFISGAARHFPAAAVTFDCFHVIWNLNFAIDEVRRAEQRAGGRGLKAQPLPVALASRPPH